ncbi:hypothetical protein [Fibrella aquatilis]|uniref:Uncharacterized protein n=1 Tax=Fibrella aquatilis TaxID=2817059 RepID=A0A939G3X9_9BACT|nr:hypothetical protein [Fibrella aquatilis]MBO0929541.1 hypothetical protein [Fibrella aquatilis]
MKEFIDSVLNREMALLIWIVILPLWILSLNSVRKSFSDVLKAFFVWKIVSLYAIFFLYASLLTWLSYKAGFWDLSLLKDTIVWTLGTAAIMVARSTKVTNWDYFREIIKDTLKWTVILEFINSFYTFSLSVELAVLPVLTLIGLLIAYSETFKDKLTGDQQKVAPLLRNVTSFIGIMILGFVVYKTVTQTGDLLTIINLKSFLLPIFFTLLFVRFVYLIALLVSYENLWVRLNFLINHRQDLTNQLKRTILKEANVNIIKLANISKNIAKPTQIYNDFSPVMINEISKGKYKGSDE